jgi:hypothetical protein
VNKIKSGRGCISYPASGVERGADGPVAERDDLPNVVDVGVGAVREHGPAAGEPELVPVDADPVLHRLLDGELLVRHVGEPGDVAAPRPRERAAVPRRRRDQAPQPLPRRGAVPFPVHQAITWVPQRPRHVLAGGVLRVLGRARAEPPPRRRRGDGGGGGGKVGRRRVVREEVEVAGRGRGGPCGGGGAGDSGGDGDGGGAGGGREAAVLPDAGEVGGAAEEKDGDEREEDWAPGSRRRGGGDVELGGRATDTHGGVCLPRSGLALLPLPASHCGEGVLLIN